MCNKWNFFCAFFIAAMQTYYVKVVTGTVWGAGTDANVYCYLFGENDDTGMSQVTKIILSRKSNSSVTCWTWYATQIHIS